MIERSESSIPALLDQAIDDAAQAPTSLRQLGELTALKGRLSTGRLQLAVLGQFKRGKSTLLNALLGAELVPTGVLPVTAIPTFIEFGEAPALSVEFEDGRTEDECDFSGAAGMQASLSQWVTEAGNPNNVRGVTRVDLRAPAALLQQNVVLIDTPGVGSTHQHNTAVAEATLPACDAALFVVSPDPPITDVEVNYLGQIKAVAQRIIVILNKIDLVTADECAQTEDFLRQALAERSGLDDAPIFRVSARQALAARLGADSEGLIRSGLPALESYLTDLLSREKQALLEVAIARKAVAVLAHLAFQVSLRLKALALPLKDLEQRGRTFDEAAIAFEAEHRQVQDLLAADRRRALEALDANAVSLTERLQATLAAEVEEQTQITGSRDAAWREIQERLTGLFEHELKETIETTRKELGAVFAARQTRIDDLVDLVARTAAELLDVPFQAPDRESTFEARVLPYWQIGRPEALNPLPPGSLDRLLPRGWREERARRRVREAIADVALRNVENLRWAVRRNLDEAFRRFGSGLDERFADSLEVTRHMLNAAIARRHAYAGETADETVALQSVGERISNRQAELTSAADALASGE